MKYPENKPISTQAKSGIFVVPLGQYAVVTLDLIDSDFYIDGNIAWKRPEVISNASLGAGVLLTVSTPFACKVNVTSFGGAIIRYKSSVDYDETLVTGSHERILSSGDQVIGPASVSGIYYSSKSKRPQFLVPEGTELDGQKYTVSLYDKKAT